MKKKLSISPIPLQRAKKKKSNNDDTYFLLKPLRANSAILLSEKNSERPKAESGEPQAWVQFSWFHSLVLCCLLPWWWLSPRTSWNLSSSVTYAGWAVGHKVGVSSTDQSESFTDSSLPLRPLPHDNPPQHISWNAVTASFGASLITNFFLSPKGNKKVVLPLLYLFRECQPKQLGRRSSLL